MIAIAAALVYRSSSGSSTDARAAAARFATAQVLVAQQNVAAAGNGYTSDDDQLVGIDRSVGIVTGASTNPSQVSMVVSTEDTLVLAALGGPGRCYVTIAASLLAGGRVTQSIEVGTCTATAHLPPNEAPA
jgi:hypothetical protein